MSSDNEVRVLAELTSEGCALCVDTYLGVLCLTQEDPFDEDNADLVTLDRNAQHALYLILKNRFGDSQ